MTTTRPNPTEVEHALAIADAPYHFAAAHSQQAAGVLALELRSLRVRNLTLAKTRMDIEGRYERLIQVIQGLHKLEQVDIEDDVIDICAADGSPWPCDTYTALDGA